MEMTALLANFTAVLTFVLASLTSVVSTILANELLLIMVGLGFVVSLVYLAFSLFHT